MTLNDIKGPYWFRENPSRKPGRGLYFWHMVDEQDKDVKYFVCLEDETIIIELEAAE
jgi:hypothetical protein